MRLFAAEWRKLSTVRTTYVLFLIGLAVSAGLVSFYVFGYQNAGDSVVTAESLRSAMRQATLTAVLFTSFIAVLSVGHEYRYNTILYSLTSVRSRLAWLFAKYLATTLAVIITVALILVATVGAHALGQSLRSGTEVAQMLPGWNFVWRALVYTVGYTTFAFMITLILRSLIGAIAFILIVPSTLETILTNTVLKENGQYLPYTALGNIVTPFSAAANTLNGAGISTATNLLVIVGYAAALSLVAVVLFLRRDAN